MQILDYIPKDKNIDILDFGCGINMPVVEALSRLGYDNIAHYDPARNKTEEPLVFLKTLRCKFDVIICRHAAYYFEKDKLTDYFDSFRECLKPGGRLIIEAINGASFTHHISYLNDPNTKSILTEHALCGLAVASRFKTVSVHGDKHKIKGLKSLIRISMCKLLEFALYVIYLTERGIDDRNPIIFTKNIFMVATK